MSIVLPFNCFESHGLTDLQKEWGERRGKKENENLSDKEIARQILSEEHKKLFDGLNDIRKSINKNSKDKSAKITIEKYPEKTDNTEKINSIHKEYDQKIAELNKPKPEPKTEKKIEETPPPEPPKDPPLAEGIYSEDAPFSLKKLELARVRSEMGLDDYEKETVTNLEAIKRASETISEWKDKGVYGKEINKIIEDANSNKISDANQNILAQHIADLRITAKSITDRDSAEYNNVMSELKKAVDAGDVLRSEAGRILGRHDLKMRGKIIESVQDVELDMMDDYGVDELTGSQKAEAEKRFNEVQGKLDKETELRIEAEKEIERLKAENELLKAKKTNAKSSTTKKTTDEYKQERSEILKSIKNKWNSAGKDILSSDIPYRKQLAAIAPDVAKLISSYVDEAANITLDQVRKLLKKDIEDNGISVSDDDVRGLIAGNFNEKKATRNELAAQVFNLRAEEKLLLQYDALESGEIPKTDKAKAIRNERRAAIRKKIDALKKENSIGKFSDEEKFLSAIKSRIKSNREKQGELGEKVAKGDFSEEPKSESILDNAELQKQNKNLYEEYLKSLIEKDNALKYYEEKRLDDKINNSGILQKIGYGVDVVLSTSKGAVAMFDQSGVLVQMLLTTGAHPIETIKILPRAIRDLVDNKWFDRSLAKLKHSKIWDIVEKSELPIYDTHGIGDDVRNEILGGRKNLLNRDIVIGGKKFSVGKALERSTATLFNNMRMYLFENRVNELYAQGKTWENSPEEFKSAARAISELTGHGKVQKDLAMASPVINKVVWSPKMMASTFNILGLGDLIRPITTLKEVGKSAGFKNIKDVEGGTKGFYSSLTPTQRKFVVKELARFIGTAATIMIAAKLTGAADDVDLDPLSTTFGSIKKSDKTVLLFGRYGSAVRTIAQVVLNKRHISGKEDILGDKYGDKKASDVAFSSFGRGKMTPAAGLAYDYLLNNKQNYYTKEPITPTSAAKSMVMPISFQQMGQDFKRDGALTGTLETLYNIYGGNVYDKKELFVNKHSPFTDEDYKDPTFKWVKDMGYELPNVALSSVKVYEKNKKESTPVSSYPKNIQDAYQKLHKQILKDNLKAVKEQKFVYVDEHNSVANKYSDSWAKGNTYKRVYFAKMTKEQKDIIIPKVLHAAQAAATKAAKKKQFGDDYEPPENENQ